MRDETRDALLIAIAEWCLKSLTHQQQLYLPDELAQLQALFDRAKHEMQRPGERG